MEGSYIVVSNTNDWPKTIGQIIEVGNFDFVLKTEELSIGIEKIRELIKNLQIKRERTVAIIFEAEKLTVEAQNAFLKTLEEPPENTTILLCTSSEDLLLETVNSRCKYIYIDSEDQAINAREILEIKKSGIDKRFEMADKIASDRITALKWMNAALITCHKLLTSDKDWAEVASAIFEAKKYLRANCNVKLTVENLFLKL